MLNEVEYCSAQSPGSNHYKVFGPEDAKESIHARTSAANLNRDHSPKSMLTPLKRGDVPGPAHYAGKDEKWKKLSTVKNFVNEPTIGKAKEQRFIDSHLKSKHFVPGVAKYSDNIEVYDKISRGPSPHYKRGR